VLKRRFRILLLAPEYDLDIQARIPTALCAIHNFIRKHDPDEGDLLTQATFVGNDVHDADEGLNAAVGVENDDLEMGMGAVRDQIAAEMWEAYTNVLRERDMLDDSDEELSGSSLRDDSEDVLFN
jgi:hypothetical protein